MYNDFIVLDGPTKVPMRVVVRIIYRGAVTRDFAVFRSNLC